MSMHSKSRCVSLIAWRRVFVHLFSILVLLSAVTLAGAHEIHEKHEPEDGELRSEVSSSNDATVSVVIISILVVISILFEMFMEALRDSADEMNMPFINSIFSELTTLGFIGLVLFVITKLNVLPSISMTYLGEEEKLLETIESLHMGLFLFIIIFLVLCCGLLKLGMIVQNEWREFERSSSDIPAVMTEYVLATEPPRTWQESISIMRWLAAKKSKREIVYLALRRRFLDYHSNHPNPERALQMAKEFQRNPEIRFPFNEYLSIISGEMLGLLIEIDLPTWISLEVFLVTVLVICWKVGPENELWILLLSGFLLVFLNHHVYSRILNMRHLLTPPRLLKDAERLRHKNEWRARHHLALEEEINEKSWILQGTDSTEEDFIPPYLDTLPHQGMDMTEHDLKQAQKSLLGGGNGIKVALFSTRLVFLLTAMHLSVFFMRTSQQIYSRFSGELTILLYLLFLLPSLMVTSLAVQIARDGLYSFTVEHMKVSRIITKVMRILKARQTLRTLRFVAEMKIYLRENVHRRQTLARTILPVTATLHESTSKYAHVTKRKDKQAVRSATMSLAQARRKSISKYDITTPSYTSPQDETYSSHSLTIAPGSPPLSPMAAYYSPRAKRSDAYKIEMERREINTIFCLFDLDGSGSVSREEMSNLLLAITHELDQDQLNRLMMDLLAGQETQEEITFESFYNWCHQHIHESTHSKEELIHEIFKMIDTDESGYITVDEFIAIFKTLGQSLDHDDVRELVYQMDRNDDGKIDFEEFSKMLQKHEI